MKQKKDTKHGFTLVELLATIVIIAIILSITGYLIVNVIGKTKETSYEVTLNEIASNASSYLKERGTELYFITVPGKTDTEYQCLTVQNLIDGGYLKDTIEESKVKDDETVNKANYIYIERNANTKAITKSAYVYSDNEDEIKLCGKAMIAQGDVVISASPSGWSRSKNVTIKYKIKNLNNVNTIDNYEYHYTYTDINNRNEVITSGNDKYVTLNDGLKNDIVVNKKGTMIGKITLGDDLIVESEPYVIDKIDITAPVINNKYNGDKDVGSRVIIPIEVIDTESGLNKETFTTDKIIVKVDNNVISANGEKDNYNLEYKNGNMYELEVNCDSYSGKLVIEIPKDTVKDNVGNVYSGNTINTDITMNAKYTVTFDGNGGTVNPSTKVVTKGRTYGEMPTATRTGYTFSGWYTAKSDGTKIDNNTVVTLKADQTLYAQWTANTYTVTFDGNGGTINGSSSKKVSYDGTYGTLPTATKTGYTFSGWYTATSGGTKIEAGTKVSITANQELYAQWTANTYTVVFNGNNGTINGDSSKMVTYDSTYGTLPTATRMGYAFNGWYTATSGGTKIETETKVSITANQDLYAQWTANTYTVTFDGNGGTVSGSSSKMVTYGGTYGTLPTATKSSYKFNGWYTATSGGTKIEAGTTVTITANQDLYAQWTYVAPVTPTPTVTPTCRIRVFGICIYNNSTTTTTTTTTTPTTDPCATQCCGCCCGYCCCNPGAGKCHGSYFD